MMLKIISGGQTGADLGALDAAIKLELPHGGWTPKGRKTENGPLPQAYRLKETSTSHYSQRTKRNVIEADGTLIVSHGTLTGGSAYCRAMAVKHGKPFLHIDLNQITPFAAAISIKNWIMEYHLRILNVAGPRASKDPKIYKAVFSLIEAVYYLLNIEGNLSASGHKQKHRSKYDAAHWPQTVDSAVNFLIKKLALKDRAYIANMFESELDSLDYTLGRYIRDRFGLWGDNHSLMKNCREIGEKIGKDPEAAVAILIKSLWSKLQKTHRLRVVK
jgi:hypothetical protein